MSSPVLTALREAVKGLSYQSEKDAPFTAFTWNEAELDAESLLRLANEPADSPVEETSLQEFAVDLTAPEPWHGEEEARTVERYRKLFALIAHHLSEVRVFRVGKTFLTIYIVGKTKSGGLAGIKTSALET